MASDVLNDNDDGPEKRFSLFLTLTDAEEQKRLFESLSNGGNVTMPLNNGFGMLTDRFGIQWMLAVE